MGNHRFRLADMLPNAWFYKLKDMSQRASKSGKSTRVTAATATAAETPKAASPPLQRKLVPNRASCYYSSRAEAARSSFSASNSKAQDTHFPVDSPRKSKKRIRRKPAAKPKLVASADPEVKTAVKQLCSVSSGCRCRAWKPQSTHDQFPPALYSPETPTPAGERDYYIDVENLLFECDEWGSWSPSCSCRVTSSKTDIIIDKACKYSTDEWELKLPPILTKPAPQHAELRTQSEDKTSDTDRSCKSRARKTSPGLQRLRLRANSPRLANRKARSHRGKRQTSSSPAVQPQQRKGLPASYAVVKASSDPQRDFRDSMIEMIEENNIRASQDLEELLACYLSLNSNEYHDVIVKVFEQIWFDLTNIKL